MYDWNALDHLWPQVRNAKRYEKADSKDSKGKTREAGAEANEKDSRKRPSASKAAKAAAAVADSKGGAPARKVARKK